MLTDLGPLLIEKDSCPGPLREAKVGLRQFQEPSYHEES